MPMTIFQALSFILYLIAASIALYGAKIGFKRLVMGRPIPGRYKVHFFRRGGAAVCQVFSRSKNPPGPEHGPIEKTIEVSDAVDYDDAMKRALRKDILRQ